MITRDAVAAAKQRSLGQFMSRMDINLAVARPACGFCRLPSISPSQNASAFATAVRGAVPPPTG